MQLVGFGTILDGVAFTYIFGNFLVVFSSLSLCEDINCSNCSAFLVIVWEGWKALLYERCYLKMFPFPPWISFLPG